jgi:hypothetical protein
LAAFREKAGQRPTRRVDPKAVQIELLLDRHLALAQAAPSARWHRATTKFLPFCETWRVVEHAIRHLMIVDYRIGDPLTRTRCRLALEILDAIRSGQFTHVTKRTAKQG